MAAKKRPDSNSVQGAVDRTRAILATHECPLKLSKEEDDIFRDVIAHREAASWDRHDLRIAGQLARCANHINQLQDLINLHGYTIINSQGTQVENSELRSMNSLTTQQLNLNKTLGLSASQKGMSGKEQDKRNAADRTARSALEKAAEEDLI